MSLTVVYDACVLYPASLRSLLMYLAMTGLYRARWTNDIHEEWMRNVQNHLTAAKRQRQSLKRLPVSVDGYLASLERQGLAQTVLRLREYAGLI